MQPFDSRFVAGTIALALCTATALAGDPKGAKAIFDSGEGSSIAMSAGAAKPARSEAVAEAPPPRYAGISYQILQMMDDGSMRPVSQARTFRNGERVKIIARTNRVGYLTVMNVGPTGNTTVLFNDYVEPFKMVEVPRGSNLKFVGEPGTERLLFMLSSEPNPLAGKIQNAAMPPNVPPQPQVQAQSNLPPPAYNQPPTTYAPPADSSTAVGAYSLPSPPTMVASIDGAKSMKGAKDMVVEDQMQSSYTVISPSNAYKPAKTGTKDLVVESSPEGVNYGVIPVSAMSGGGILTLDVNLKHR